MGKRHWQEIDVLYTLGILLVVIGHSHSSDWSTFKHTLLEDFIQFIYTFHMALFFAIAGFLFQNSDKLTKLGYIKWLKDKALRLMTPYLFWSLVALLPKFYFEHHSFDGLTVGYILQSIICPRLNIWGHFWFLPTLFLLYLSFGAIQACVPASKIRSLLVAELVGTAVLYFIPLKSLVLGLSDLKDFAVFFVIGLVSNKLLTQLRILEEEKHSIWRLSACFAATSLAFFLRISAHNHRALAFPVALLMLICCWLLATKVQPRHLARYLSGHNFTIYIFSWMFQSVAMLACEKFHCAWLTTSTVMFVFGMLGPVGLIAAYEHLPLSRYRFLHLVFGVRAAHNPA